MPTIYKYIGIIIRFFSDEHEPIHVHAEYGGAIVKISLFVKDGMIYKLLTPQCWVPSMQQKWPT